MINLRVEKNESPDKFIERLVNTMDVIESNKVIRISADLLKLKLSFMESVMKCGAFKRANIMFNIENYEVKIRGRRSDLTTNKVRFFSDMDHVEPSELRESKHLLLIGHGDYSHLKLKNLILCGRNVLRAHNSALSNLGCKDSENGCIRANASVKELTIDNFKAKSAILWSCNSANVASEVTRNGESLVLSLLAAGCETVLGFTRQIIASEELLSLYSRCAGKLSFNELAVMLNSRLNQYDGGAAVVFGDGTQIVPGKGVETMSSSLITRNKERDINEISPIYAAYKKILALNFLMKKIYVQSFYSKNEDLRSLLEEDLKNIDTFLLKLIILNQINASHRDIKETEKEIESGMITLMNNYAYLCREGLLGENLINSGSGDNLVQALKTEMLVSETVKFGFCSHCGNAIFRTLAQDAFGYIDYEWLNCVGCGLLEIAPINGVRVELDIQQREELDNIGKIHLSLKFLSPQKFDCLVIVALRNKAETENNLLFEFLCGDNKDNKITLTIPNVQRHTFYSVRISFRHETGLWLFRRLVMFGPVGIQETS